MSEPLFCFEETVLKLESQGRTSSYRIYAKIVIPVGKFVFCTG